MIAKLEMTLSIAVNKQNKPSGAKINNESTQHNYALERTAT